jgi:hypothetical protein
MLPEHLQPEILTESGGPFGLRFKNACYEGGIRMTAEISSPFGTVFSQELHWAGFREIGNLYLSAQWEEIEIALLKTYFNNEFEAPDEFYVQLDHMLMAIFVDFIDYHGSMKLHEAMQKDSPEPG